MPGAGGARNRLSRGETVGGRALALRGAFGRVLGCRTYLEQMRQTIATLGKLTEESIPAADRETLLDLFRNWRQAAP